MYLIAVEDVASLPISCAIYRNVFPGNNVASLFTASTANGNAPKMT